MLRISFPIENKGLILSRPPGIVFENNIVQEQINSQRGRMKKETQSVFGYAILLIGILLTVVGLCILIINLLKH